MDTAAASVHCAVQVTPNKAASLRSGDNATSDAPPPAAPTGFRQLAPPPSPFESSAAQEFVQPRVQQPRADQPVVGSLEASTH